MSAGAYLPSVGPAPRLRPSAWWYAAAGGIAAAGITAGIWMAVDGVKNVVDAVEDFDRTDVPGTLVVTIEDPGGYSIYHEFEGAADMRSPSLIQDPDVTVSDPLGQAVDLRPYTSVVTYTWGTIEGRGLSTFRAEEPGTYELTADGDTGTTIAVGRGLGDIGQEELLSPTGGVLGGLLTAGVAIVAASILAIWTGVARSRNRRALLPPPPHLPPTGWAPAPTWPRSSPTPWPPPPTRPSPTTPQDARPQPPPAPQPAPPPHGQPDPGVAERSVAGEATLRGSQPEGMMAAGPPVSGRPDAPLPWSRPALNSVSRPGDPPSLRSPADWSRSDVEIPWDPDSV